MARFVEKATPQIEADKVLLNYKCYEDYLDSLATFQDKCYLQSVAAARNIAALGYRSSGETLSKEQFEKRLAAVMQYLYPKFKPTEAFSDGVSLSLDSFILELASRERPSRVGILSTIIFVRCYIKGGLEVSGYIDFTDRLMKEDLKPFFAGEERLIPLKSDLGYYHWKSGMVVSNDSSNYKVLQDPQKGLLFQNRFDRKVINPDPNSIPGENTNRKRVYSDEYELVILFDHLVRQRI